MVAPAGQRPYGRAGSGSDCRPALVLPEDDDAVDDPDREEEERQRPPRVGAPDREQRADRTEAATDDPDDPAVGVARHQGDASGELNQPKHDENPAHRVEVG